MQTNSSMSNLVLRVHCNIRTRRNDRRNDLGHRGRSHKGVSNDWRSALRLGRQHNLGLGGKKEGPATHTGGIYKVNRPPSTPPTTSRPNPRRIRELGYGVTA